MAVGMEDHTSVPQPIPEASHRGAPVSNDLHGAVSPPSKRELVSWWKKFGRKAEKDEEKVVIAPGIFGVPLSESIRYANVAISLTNEQGESFIYGYVPIVVAKCGVFLKEKATDVEGIFRLSGSAKRIKDLQTTFNSPDRYGKGLDWTGYTVHDAANILRRYLNQLPEPIVPLDFYEHFRDPLRQYQAQVGNDPDAQAMNNTEHNKAVTAYQKLITELPALNRQLLLYILDLLAVFASKSDLNRMTAANLAAIFQPGIISHPSHDMAPQEYRLSQEVLIFLIENQDNFLIGMTGTAVDEKTQKDVESGAPSVKAPKSTIGRSASNASAGADSLRKYGVRRNVSVSSHNSRTGSPNISSPGTPSSPSAFTAGSGSGGLARSNTVPSKRSPAIGSHRFQRPSDSSQPSTPTAIAPEPIPASHPEQDTENPVGAPEFTNSQAQSFVDEKVINEPSTAPIQTQDVNPSLETSHGSQYIQTSSQNQPNTRDRKISNLFSRSPVFGPSENQLNQQRQPRKLQKRQRMPGSLNDSAQSSQASLHADESGGFHTPAMTPNIASHDLPDPVANFAPGFTNTVATPTTEHANNVKQTSPSSREVRNQSQGLMPPKSPAASIHSRGSATEPSDIDALDDPAVREEKRRHKWRPSFAKKHDDSPLAPPPPIGSLPGARSSNSSIGSNRPRKSFTGDSQTTQPSGIDTSSAGQLSVTGVSSQESGDPNKDGNADGEKKGLFSKWKAKVSQSKEERREREAEKERAKSPPRTSVDTNAPRSSLSAMVREPFSPRGRSFDKPREDSTQHLASVAEQPKAEGTTEREVAVNSNAEPPKEPTS